MKSYIYLLIYKTLEKRDKNTGILQNGWSPSSGLFHVS